MILTLSPLRVSMFLAFAHTNRSTYPTKPRLALKCMTLQACLESPVKNILLFFTKGELNAIKNLLSENKCQADTYM